MDQEKFGTYVRKWRDNLEMLLFGREPLYKRMDNSFLNLINLLEEFDEYSKEQNHCKFCIQIGPINVPSFISLRIFRFLLRISATARYGNYHEIGETSYIMPLLSLYMLLNPHEEIKIEGSKITASDVFGDLLASTFSPLTPKQQLGLLERENLDDFINLPLKDYMFIAAQLDTIERYKTRKEEGYVYGPELKDFYRQILELQLGFNDAERKKFQLRLYDTAQRQIGDRLRMYNKISQENLATIFFNADSLISELKS